ncbi:MAG: GNAT family N-acetyltransferase [Gammaproteobacteria bacterium]
MNQGDKLKISKLTEGLSSKLLENLYSLNQENTPEVGSLNDAESFRKLLELSSTSLLIEYKNQVIGFMICFRENLVYGSENYKFFNDKKEKFIYIDRVVIKSGFRRMGFGTEIYKHIDEAASKNFLPICCEVNSMPRNEISINFHIKNGFTEVGEKNFFDHSVKYFEKYI